MTRMWATVLLDEVVDLGYDRAYPTFTRRVRERDLRPHCQPCQSSTGRATVDIEHPQGEEIQWDWLELTDTPWGEKAYVLVGALSHSSRCRGWFSESDDQAHLVVGIDEILRRHGGTPPLWRVDRMATVIRPGTADVQRSFMPVAKHYGVTVAPCPPRHANRKGVVEKAIHYLTQGWWRTARVSSPAESQASLDRFCIETADTLYQQLRSHLAYLKLTAAAEALPGELDAAMKAKSTPPKPAVTLAGCGLRTSRRHGGWRTSTSMPSPRSTRR